MDRTSDTTHNMRYSPSLVIGTARIIYGVGSRKRHGVGLSVRLSVQAWARSQEILIAYCSSGVQREIRAVPRCERT